MYKFGKSTNPVKQQTKIYFNISYDQKDEAKSKKYRWDPSEKSWYKLFDEEINFEQIEYEICNTLNSQEIINKFENIRNEKLIQVKDILYSS